MKPLLTEAHYTEWQKWFAWRPVEMLNGKKIWLKLIYKRRRIVPWTPPQFPPDAFNKNEYATWDYIMFNKLKEN